MKKKFLSVILCITMVMSIFSIVPFSAFAAKVDSIDLASLKESIGESSPDEPIPYGDFRYRVLSDGTAKITDYNGDGGDVTIPPTLDGYSVTSIGYYAFYYCTSLTSITIPNSVTSIGEGAFSECSSLASVTIPNSVTSIDRGAFSYCYSLTSITIPNSVTSIGYYAFYNCTSLKEINVSSDNSKYSSQDGVLFNKDKTELILYPAGKTDTSYAIPNSVTNIGDWAFYNCKSLESITIPNSVTSIGVGAFYNCRSLKSVTIGNSVTSIVEKAFYNCTSLASVTIGNSVTSIGEKAFHNCTSLASVTIPNSVTSIGGSAFYNCTSLKSVTIPNSVTSIGDTTFGYNYGGKTDGFTIYGTKGTEAERYANDNEFTFIESGEKIHGDADKDGEITIMDATCIQKHLAKMIDESQIDLSVCDVDKDGEVSVMDATCIQKYLAGIK